MALRRRRKEGRKRATRPTHTCHPSFLAIEQREITKDGGGGGGEGGDRRKGARNHAEKPGKGGQLEPSHYNDWLSLQKQTPHLLCSLLPQLPAVIIRLCVCEHALVNVVCKRTRRSVYVAAAAACKSGTLGFGDGNGCAPPGLRKPAPGLNIGVDFT
ncbi:hypothetical protein HZU73_00927 [Apis mellifera caucasica]|uniref:Uncharacterized protein LOC107965348 n=1 Tax=Apis mellifera TaxID=7460 RepID=A0A7M7IUR8_APIME|nr:uncharacterized protein LOC107965348 [Apis mellifera]KAG6803769.1 hypothetical protein HZU73_00927 [Apis mellifera caucasica]KAG9430209.1 hypothetical protein HZU67_08490 [Apis mellifera carnica]|eukprot:XP_016770986.1 uncharacterized protein LOC107965348 [Apis mellifera]